MAEPPHWPADGFLGAGLDLHCPCARSANKHLDLPHYLGFRRAAGATAPRAGEDQRQTAYLADQTYFQGASFENGLSDTIRHPIETRKTAAETADQRNQ